MTRTSVSTRALIQLAIILAIVCGGLVGAKQPVASTAPPESGWTMPTFMISHWSFPKDEKRLEQFARAGFNAVIAVPEELPACRQHGWQALLAVPADKAAEFTKDPVVWGYFLIDEPAQKRIAYETLVERMQAFHKLDPHRPAYINLNEKDDPQAFIKLLSPRVLSYDYYQWWAGSEPFFPLLEKYRAAALGANIPLICWTEAVAAPHGPPPADNEARIRHSVYSALAYGAKGIQWWAWRADSSDCAKINAELKVLGPVLVNLRSVEVFHTAPLPPQTRPLPTTRWVQSPTESLVLGLFTNQQHEDFALVANRNWKQSSEATLLFDATVLAAALLDRQSGKWQELTLAEVGDQKKVVHKLPPADGVLLRAKRSK